MAKPGAYDGFGEADEDGLHLIAALETLESLEPVFGDEIDAEASVTIVHRTEPAAETDPWIYPATDGEEAPLKVRPARSLRDRLGRIVRAPDPSPDPEETAVEAPFIGFVEEATVQIILLDAPTDIRPSSETTQPRDLPPQRPPRVPTIRRRR